ncbi:hypothetical protein [Laspinema palackyanum]
MKATRVDEDIAQHSRRKTEIEGQDKTRRWCSRTGENRQGLKK